MNVFEFNLQVNVQSMIFICMDQRWRPLLLLSSCISFQITTPLTDLSIRLIMPPSVYLFFVSDAYECFLVMPRVAFNIRGAFVSKCYSSYIFFFYLWYYFLFKSLALRRCGNDDKGTIFKLIIQNIGSGNCHGITLMRKAQNLPNECVGKCSLLLI